MLVLTYDTEGDAAYFAFKTIADGEACRQRRLTRKTIVDLNEAGDPIGVELLWVSEGVDLRGAPRAEEIAAALNRLGTAAASIQLDRLNVSEAV